MKMGEVKLDTSRIRAGIEQIMAEAVDELVEEYLDSYPVESDMARGVLTGFATWLKREVGCEAAEDHDAD